MTLSIEIWSHAFLRSMNLRKSKQFGWFTFVCLVTAMIAPAFAVLFETGLSLSWFIFEIGDSAVTVVHLLFFVIAIVCSFVCLVLVLCLWFPV